MVEEGVNKCMACSRAIKGIGDKHLYYLKNKPAILADINLAGQTKARKKWLIPSGTLTGLLRRWERNGSPVPAPAPAADELKSEGVITTPTPRIKAPAPAPGDNGSRELPAWSNDWPEAVMLKWLEIYQERR